MKLCAIVLAGGSGTRLWPLTRHLPKQLIPFRQSTLLEQTLDRVAPAASAGVIVVTSREYLEHTHERARRYDAVCVAEPSGRNTALAVAYALADPALHDTQLVCILPSDHVIDEHTVFRQALIAAAEYAAVHNTVVLFGMRPTSASSLYGYIRYIPAYHEPYTVVQFVEKPHQQRAQELCAQGDVLWNCGMICARVATLRALYAAHAPDYYRAAQEARAGDTALWMQCVPEPIDRVVLEHAEQLCVMPLGCAWADVGSLEQFLRYAGAIYSTHGRPIISELHDIAVVDTPECTIIARLPHIDGVVARAKLLIQENLP